MEKIDRETGNIDRMKTVLLKLYNMARELHVHLQCRMPETEASGIFTI